MESTDPTADPAASNDPFNFALDALFDETDNVDVIPIESEDSESEIEEGNVAASFQAAWF